jgi:hypothetical protein
MARSKDTTLARGVAGKLKALTSSESIAAAAAAAAF